LPTQQCRPPKTTAVDLAPAAQVFRTQLKSRRMGELNQDPNSAPKDGSIINVQFRDGMTNKARWNRGTGQWEALDSIDRWRLMRFLHGGDSFERWWRD
jgi:hypothetical protein